MDLLRRSGPALLLALAAAVPLHAAQVVQFTDGRTLEVERVEVRNETATLQLPGGGSIVIPAGRLANWTELVRVAEAPPAPAPTSRQAWRSRAGRFAELIGRAAQEHEVDPVLLTAMAEVESAFDPNAVSHKGAQGILQLMPQTAERFGVTDAFDPAQNVDGGARYMRWLLERYDGSTELALAGYNAGEQAVDRYQGIPPFPETQRYVARVIAGADRLNGGASGEGAVNSSAAARRGARLGRN